MPPASPTAAELFPLPTGDGEAIVDVQDALRRLMEDSDNQIEDKLEDIPSLDVDDFALSCDALNYGRMLLRFSEEWQDSRLVLDQGGWLREAICTQREYDPEEFDLAVMATRDRVRVPYGVQPLELAFQRFQRCPIELLDSELADNRLLTAIAGIAVYLSKLEYRSYILLPVEKLRELFQCRKVAITGAIRVLLDRKILEDMGTKYTQGRARRFYCIANEGEHYRFVDNLAKRKPR